MSLLTQRNTELLAVQHEKTHQVLGARKENMLVISTLATAPSAQRRGYAGALVRTVTDEVSLVFHTLAQYIYAWVILITNWSN